MDKIGRAYGAGLSGGPIDPMKLIRKPRIILRLLSWLFCLIVFACITTGGWYKDDASTWQCVYNEESNACNFGVAIGVIGFITCTIFLVAVLGTFFFFVTFCYLTNKWSNRRVIATVGVNNPQAAIAFSFFAIFTWAGLAFYGWRRYQEGAANAFAGEEPFDPNVGGANIPGYGYAGADGTTQSYQEPPFTASNEGMPQYQQPAY